MWSILHESPLMQRIIECGRGRAAGPWRLAALPSNVRIVGQELLDGLLNGAGSAPPPRFTSKSSDQSHDPRLLRELGDAVARGIGLRFLGRLLEDFLRAPDADVRATAARIESQRLLKLGRVKAAGQHVAAALAYFSDAGRVRPVEHATALNTAGCIAYRECELGQALALAGQELEVLRGIDDAVLRNHGIARNMRRVAFTTARLDDWASAHRAAAEAETHATEAEDPNLIVLTRLAAARLRALDGSPREAAAEFERLLASVPVSYPAALLQGRRFHCEALYLVGDQATADALARSVVVDAGELGLARETVAALRLLEFHGRKDVLELIPPDLRSVRRDRLVDADLLARAKARAASLK
jgi:hypothetical protein